MRAKWDLGLHGGISIANPVPAEEEIPDRDGRRHRPGARRLRRAGHHRQGHHALSLARVVELTDGASLRTNIALVRNNAGSGAALACAWSAR